VVVVVVVTGRNKLNCKNTLYQCEFPHYKSLHDKTVFRCENPFRWN
jgi:hypothetical protein